MTDIVKNATMADIRNLNALLVKELTTRIVSGDATSSDLSTAQKVVTASQVRPEQDTFDPHEHHTLYTHGEPEHLEWPVDVDALADNAALAGED